LVTNKQKDLVTVRKSGGGWQGRKVRACIEGGGEEDLGKILKVTKFPEICTGRAANDKEEPTLGKNLKKGQQPLVEVRMLELI